MLPEKRFTKLPPAFWANVRTISEKGGYSEPTKRKRNDPAVQAEEGQSGSIRVFSVQDMRDTLRDVKLGDSHIFSDGQPTPLAHALQDYFKHRANVLNNTVQKHLMDAARAEEWYEKLKKEYRPTAAPTMNKQTGDKAKVAYLTEIVNILVLANADGMPVEIDPKFLTTVTKDGAPLRTFSRRFDGCAPSHVNPVGIWEIKEYYHTTTFGSRVADGVYESLLDGMELEELREKEKIDIQHLLMVDAYHPHEGRPRTMTMTIASNGTLGPTLDATNLTAVLAHVLEVNALAPTHGELPTPVCIWGPHGIGKTALVRELARTRGWGFVEIAPAQFEELGDLHGLPTRLDGGTGNAKDGRTGFLPPTWVPQTKGPGILLLDDLNRADERVLRALMGLILDRKLYSWALPSDWQIVATCNPDSGSYSVTPMDDAMLTRMLHFTMTFDARVWARWACDAGIDKRCIEFVTTYPEAVLGRRTTPRTLVQLFRLLAPIPDFKSARELVTKLAHATLDVGTAASFVSFICVEQRQLASAKDILDAATPADARKLIVAAATDHAQGGRLRIDRVGLVIARIEEVIEADDYSPGPRHAANLSAVLASNEVPRDLGMRLHRALARRGLGHLVRDRAVAKRLLNEGAS